MWVNCLCCQSAASRRLCWPCRTYWRSRMRSNINPNEHLRGPHFRLHLFDRTITSDWCLSMIVHSFQTAWWHCHMDLGPCLVFPNPEGEFTGPGSPTLGKPPGCWWRLLVHGSWRVIAQAKSLSQPQVTADDTDLLLISRAWISRQSCHLV